MKRLILWPTFLTATMFALGGLGACAPGGGQPGGEATPGGREGEPVTAGTATGDTDVSIDPDAQIAIVEATTIEFPVRVTGTFEPVRTTDVNADENGVVTALGPVDRRNGGPGELPVGSWLRTAEVIVELRNLELRTTLQQLDNQIAALEARLFGTRGPDAVSEDGTEAPSDAELTVAVQVAADNLKRIEDAASRSAIPQSRVDEARRAWSAAVTAHETARRQLEGLRTERELVRQRVDSLKVLAPFNGRITHRYVDLGQSVSGRPVVSMIDDSELELVVGVPETVAHLVRVGQTRVRLIPDIPGLPGRNQLVITAIAPQIQQSNRTLQCRARFTNPAANGSDDPSAPRLVKANAFATAEVRLRATGHFVPPSAVQESDSQDRVMIIDRDNMVHERLVSRGITTESLVEITDGVKPGDRLIIGRPAGVRDGIHVRMSHGSSSQPINQ